MPKYPSSEYKFIKFRKSNSKGKKYDAILQNRKTGRNKTIPFGDATREHFKDTTGLNIWSHKNHNDKQRLKNFQSRFRNVDRSPYSAMYFSWNFLW